MGDGLCEGEGVGLWGGGLGDGDGLGLCDGFGEWLGCGCVTTGGDDAAGPLGLTDGCGGWEGVASWPEGAVGGTGTGKKTGNGVRCVGAGGAGVGDGVTDGCGECDACFVRGLWPGTTTTGVPCVPGNVEKPGPGAACCVDGVTTAFEPKTTTVAVAAVVTPTRQAAVIVTLVEVAASTVDRCVPAHSFTAGYLPVGC